MSLSNDLIAQFVKATKDDKATSNETTLLGTVVFDGRYYVKLDGSDQLTPIATTTDVHEDERVTVMIKNHTATVTGNMSSPAARTDDVKDVVDEVSEFEIVMAYKVTSEDLEAINATIQALRAKVAKFDNMESLNADINNLEAKYADLEYVNADTFEALNAEIESLEAKFGEFTDISTEDLDAMYADIGSLKAYTADFTYVSADVLNAFKAAIEDLEVKKLSAEQADLKYANIDFSNIGEAAITKIFTESGIIKDLVVSEGTITGELVGVTIKGDLIEGGTVKADKLVVKGSDGLYYKLNVEAGATTSEEVTEEELQNGLHGTAIIAKTITAEKIAVDDLVAFDATIGGFNITNKAIYSGVKESVDNTTQGIYMDNEGQLAVGDQSNYLKYYKDTDGTYKLAISAGSIVLSASGKSVEEVIENIQPNIQVGARNLIRNSKDLLFEKYIFEDATLEVTYDEEGNVIVESNAVAANADEGDSAEVVSTLFDVTDDGDGGVTAASDLDANGGTAAEMQYLTIGGITFEVVDGKARVDIATIFEMLGSLEDLATEDKSSIIAAINEIYVTGGIGTGGGGGGGAPTFTATLTNLMESRVITIPEGESVVLRLNYSSVDNDGMDDGPGVGQVLVSGVVRHTFSAVQGENEIDITSYLLSGTNNVSVKVTNSENVTKTMTYTVTLATVSLTSSFDAAAVYTGAISFPYTPTGLAEKTVHFELDGRELGTVTVTTSGRQISYSIPAQSHGAHVLRVWFTCVVAGTTITSNVLYYSIICTVAGNTTPIIAVTTPPVSSVEQYTNLVKKYRVYDPSSLTAAITLEVNDEVVSSLTVDRTEQTWSYQPTAVGELSQTIRCGDESVSWTQTVTASSIHVEAETEALALHLSSYGRSNNEANPDTWENNGVSAEFTNFNFVSDGWMLDEDNVTVLRVTGNARLYIPYKIFAYDFRTTGKTLEFELATREVLNYDAEVLSCYSGGRGFVITAQQLTMSSEQSSMGTRYKEDEHIRVSIVAEKRSESRLLLCYINGILSGAIQYPDDDDFSQATPVGITIGSNNCTTDLYNIRIYDNSLTRYQILDNWIADTQNPEDRTSRYKRNEIYDAYGQIVISQLPSDLPYMVIQGPESPQFKDDKKTVSGYYTDPLHPEKSYSFSGAQIDVQGTSSQYYYRKNYKIKYKNGFVTYDGKAIDKYQLNDSAVPTDVFTMKADVASSEGAFNVVLSMLYNELCPYKTPAQEADPKIRQTIEGYPCVIFWDYGNGPEFIGKYNFNNDKGTPEVFGFKTGDESWETLQNGTDRVGWHSADFSDDSWKTDFEARYPEDNVNTTRLKALAEWLVSTDTAQATGAAITPVTYDGVEYTTDTVEYRLAKFSAELSDHFIEEAVIFYYLFTEIALSIDQREKNAFPTYLVDEDRWIVLFYDADSSCGTDNKGNLAFDYYLEDIDYTEGGDPIYNGQNSVLWKNLRATRYAEIMAMYQSLRTSGAISYDVAIGKFEAHQSKWPEAIFNEDMYVKCIEPLILDGDGIYLPMLQGKKEQWMKWWLYNRFRYLDSKYITGTSMTNRITIRTHAQANVSLTSYVNMYGHVYYNAEMVEHRMNRGQEYEFVWAASGAEDAVIGINDADMLTSLGDLSPLMVELIDVSGATHITSLKLGDSAPDYKNYSMNSITLGNNTLLRTLDVRNCPNLTAGPDVSGCTNIEEIYFDGTSITGLKLPVGGVLKKLHLPGTLANLTIRNQTGITEFVMPNYSNITTLWLENNSAVVDPLEILGAVSSNSRVRIVGFNYEAENDTDVLNFIARLDSMRGLDENGSNTDTAQVSGRIFVDVISIKNLDAINAAKSRYPSLSIEYSSIKYYTVYFYNGDVLLQAIENVQPGASVRYTGTTPVKPDVDNPGDYAFAGWSPEPTNISGDTVCYAVFTCINYLAKDLIQRTLSGEYENTRVTTIGWGAFSNMASLTSYSFPNVTSVGAYAFGEYYTYNNASFNLPSAIEIGEYAFTRMRGLHEIVLPAATTIGAYAFSECNGMTIADLPSATTIGASVFQSCSALTTVILRNTSGVCSLANTNAFTSTPIASGTGYIYVPSILVSSYKAATNWSTYSNQIRAIEDYPDICGGE